MTIDTAAATTEERICVDVIALLHRQNEEPVAPQLLELRAQLQAIYIGKTKDIAVCQLGLALCDVGLGNPDEARYFLKNLTQIAVGRPDIIGNAMIAITNMGDLRQGQILAHDVFDRYPGLQGNVRQVLSVFEDTLDFKSAATALEQLIKIVENDDALAAAFKERLAFVRELDARAADLGYTSSDLLTLAEFAVEVIRGRARNIHCIGIRGTMASTAVLEYYVDADPEAAAELHYDLADALCEKFESRTAVDLLPFSVRSFVGRPCANEAGARS